MIYVWTSLECTNILKVICHYIFHTITIIYIIKEIKDAKGRTINHPGRGVVRRAMARFFFSPRFFLGTKIFGPKLGPIFFHFLPLCSMGENQWLEFLFFQKFWPVFFLEPMPGPIFFHFRTPPG